MHLLAFDDDPGLEQSVPAHDLLGVAQIFRCPRGEGLADGDAVCTGAVDPSGWSSALVSLCVSHPAASARAASVDPMTVRVRRACADKLNPHALHMWKTGGRELPSCIQKPGEIGHDPKEQGGHHLDERARSATPPGHRAPPRDLRVPITPVTDAELRLQGHSVDTSRVFASPSAHAWEA